MGRKLRIRAESFADRYSQGSAILPLPGTCRASASKVTLAEIRMRMLEPSIQAHFGRTLKKIFPFSPEHSEPNEMHTLLQQIQAKLEKRS